MLIGRWILGIIHVIIVTTNQEYDIDWRVIIGLHMQQRSFMNVDTFPVGFHTDWLYDMIWNQAWNLKVNLSFKIQSYKLK